LRTPTGEFFGPIRPTGRTGRDPSVIQTIIFIVKTAFFPGGGSQYFTGNIRTDAMGRPNFELNPPGVGRNSLRGPKYFNVDMSVAKRLDYRVSESWVKIQTSNYDLISLTSLIVSILLRLISAIRILLSMIQDLASQLMHYPDA
jgi:hypothetical protein